MRRERGLLRPCSKPIYDTWGGILEQHVALPHYTEQSSRPTSAKLTPPHRGAACEGEAQGGNAAGCISHG
jgi:hypothetical protein